MQDDSAPTEGGDGYANANALPKGTRLFEFEIERVLGEGGFAIVYLAFDHSLHRHVALKEYLPAEFAYRQDAATILLRSVAQQKTFEAGRKSFVQEARFLAQFEHPSLVKVHRVFESNGTAYMVQGYYAGQSLGAILKTGQPYGSEAEMRPIVAALLGAVDLLHSRQCLHRDIAPDNIIIQPNGVPVLLDFGAARRIIGDMTQALTAVLKPSFAPIEQYTEDGGLAQGPWTDVYALAATLRMAITGKPPPSSVGRTIKDGLVRLADDPPPNFGLTFLRGIDAGLGLLPADRPQSITDFRNAMGLEADEEPPAHAPPEAPEIVARPSSPAMPPPPKAVTVPLAKAATVPRAQAAPPPPIRKEPVPPPPSAPPPMPPPAPPETTRRRFKRSDAMLAVIAAAALGLMLIVPFVADWIWSPPASTRAPPPRGARDDRPPAPAPAPSSATAPAPAPVTPPSPSPGPPATSAPSPPVAAATQAAPPPAATKEGRPAAQPEKPVAPPAAAPPAKVATAAPELPPPKPEAPPRQETPPPKASPPATSLIPSPSQAVTPSPAPAPREDPPSRPAAAVPPAPAVPQSKPAATSPAPTASLAPPEAPKARRSLVRVAGEAPVYPREAIRSGIETGRVVALVTVDAQGNVADVDIVRSEPPRVFDRAARAALVAWKFRSEGERYQGEVELIFNLKQ